jgi:uroporphyrinogen-III synthase
MSALATTALAGRRVLVTRPADQAGALVERLAARGALPVVLPTIAIAPLADTAALDGAIGRLAGYDWIIFTSANGVTAFWERLAAAGLDGRALAGRSVAAIGPATAEALRERGVAVAFIPEEYVAERILDGLGDVAGRRVLLPRAEIARKALAGELRARGAEVEELAAYRTLAAPPDPEALAELRAGVDAITFTSSSTVRHFVELAGPDTGNAVIACIGPITAQTARELGLPVDVVAREYTLDGLVRALEAYFAGP